MMIYPIRIKRIKNRYNIENVTIDINDILNDESIDNKNTEQFLDRRLNDISKISKFKKPFNELKSFSSNLKNTKNQ